jgi:hypothetical protein
MPQFSVEDIHRLVARVEGRRQTQPWLPAGPIIADPADSDDHGVVPNDTVYHRAGSQYWPLREPSLVSGSSGHTHLSGYDVMSSAASESTAITVPTITSEDEVLTAHPIPCEFWQYSHCPQTFHSVSTFIDHCLDHHQRPLPKTSVCWHCDDWLFSAPTDSPESRSSCYFSRLWHIGGHYRSEAPGPVRPDHFVLRHLHANRTISTQRFNELNINESRNLERFMSGFMYSPPPQGRYDEQIAGARGRARREARRHRGL